MAPFWWFCDDFMLAEIFELCYLSILLHIHWWLKSSFFKHPFEKVSWLRHRKSVMVKMPWSKFISSLIIICCDTYNISCSPTALIQKYAVYEFQLFWYIVGMRSFPSIIMLEKPSRRQLAPNELEFIVIVEVAGCPGKLATRYIYFWPQVARSCNYFVAFIGKVIH